MLETDNNNQSAFCDQTEWANAFGVSALPMQNDVSYLSDGETAFKEIEPGGAPDTTITNSVFWQVEQIANGIQLAGPNLTPATFERGMMALGHRPNVPRWSVP